LERLSNFLEGGAVLDAFIPRGLILLGEAVEGCDHGVLVLLLLGG
jgi:hypothetical protein